MMHWCADETFLLLSALPYIGYVFTRCHAWWHVKFHHPCHKEHCEKEHCEKDHVEHTDDAT